MLTCYTALIELDHPESAVHAAARLDHPADLHSAVARPAAGQPVLILTFPAEGLGHAVQTVLSLMRATGHRPVRYTVMTADQGEAQHRPDRPGPHGRHR